jgi:hypothetical protein
VRHAAALNLRAPEIAEFLAFGKHRRLAPSGGEIDEAHRLFGRSAIGSRDPGNGHGEVGA